MRNPTHSIIFWVISVFLVFSSFVCSASVERFQYVHESMEHSKVPESKMYSPTPNIQLLISAGVNRRVSLVAYDTDDTVVYTFNDEDVTAMDTFTLGLVTYQGVSVDAVLPGNGIYRLHVQVFDGASAVSDETFEVIIDNANPTVSGNLFWGNAAGYYHDRHTDGLIIGSLAQLTDVGFDGLVSGISGIKNVTFTSTFLDGPMAGEQYAEKLPAAFDGERIFIGNGAKSSVTSTYIPRNTRAKMRFTFSVTTHAGVTSTKSEDVYVSTARSTASVQPYAIFTGVNSTFNGIDAFHGFETYVPGMTVSTNPVRMIYRGARSEFYGGGGEADIYGVWLRGRRSTDYLVHSDDDYLYFDITGTSLGDKIDPLSVWVRGMSNYRTNLLLHDLTLTSDAQPPAFVEMGYFLQKEGKWYRGANNFRTYATRSTATFADDVMSKISVEVEPRNYQQTVAFTIGSEKVNCAFAPSQTYCEVDVNIAYPSTQAGVHHRRINITALPSLMRSNELSYVWYYDGSPAQLESPVYSVSPDNKTLTLHVAEAHANQAWGGIKLHAVRPYAVRASEVVDVPSTFEPPEAIRTYLTENSANETTDSNHIRHFTGEYDLSLLGAGEYVFYAELTDGFNTTYSNQFNHYIASHTIPDIDAPAISASVPEGQTLSTIQALIITLTDASDAEVTSIQLQGGPAAINMSLPVVPVGEKQYRPDQVYLMPSDKERYHVTVTAQDTFGNVSTYTQSLYYMPTVIPIGDVVLPAIASPLRSENGKPHNVLLTPPIKDSSNQLARGIHKVYFTLDAASKSAFTINGERVEPGHTIGFEQNLSLNGHRLRIEAYPTDTGVETSADYTLHIPYINVSICPKNFTENLTQCIYLDVQPSKATCQAPFTLDERGYCSWTHTYEIAPPACKEGYSRTDLTCETDMNIAKVPVCPPSHGLSDDGQTCIAHSTTQMELCLAPAVYEDGLCKTGDSFTSAGLYCDGHDVSGGNVCVDGKCYEPVPEWNACDVTVQTPASMTCPDGVDNGDDCLLRHTYQLNAACPFQYNRDNLTCSRLLIQEAVKTCDEADGFSLTEDGLSCLKTEYMAFSGCPDTTHELVDGRCHALKDVDITCPDKTYTFNAALNTCEKTINYEANALCPTSSIGDWTDNTSGCDYYHQQNADACSEGYLYSAGNCFEIIDAKQVCPLEFVNDGRGTCVYEDAVNVSHCPADTHRLIDGFCHEIIDANQSCLQAGYAIIDGQCRATDVTEIDSCPDAVKVDGKCHETEPAKAYCESPYVDINGTCTYSQTDVIDSCPPSTHIQQGDYCFEVVNASETCASGWTLNRTTLQCEQTNISVVSACPTNYKLQSGHCYEIVDAKQSCQTPGYTNQNNGTCTLKEVIAPVSCDAGYELIAGECRQKVNATKRCATTGFVMQSDGTCMGTALAQPMACDSGYELVAGVCRAIKPADVKCLTSGYTDPDGDGICTKSEVSDPISCQSGYELVSGQCKAIKSATKQCDQAGYTLNQAGECTSTQTTNVIACPTGTVLYNGSCHAVEKATPYCSDGDMQGSFCVTSETVNPVGCSSGVLVSGQCYSFSSGKLACPLGTTDAGMDYECVYETVQNISSCSTGYYKKQDNSTGRPACYASYTHTISDADCGSGYTYNPYTEACYFGKYGDADYDYFTPDFQAMCPSSYPIMQRYADNTVICFANNVPVYKSPPANCLVGFSYDKNINACIGSGQTDKIMTCGTNQTPYYTGCRSTSPNLADGICPTASHSLNTSTGLCELDSQSPVQYACNLSTHDAISPNSCRDKTPDLTVGTCTDGAVLNTATGRCEKALTGTTSYVCNTSGDSLYNGKSCISSTPTNSAGICPTNAGWTLDNSTGKCVRTLTQVGAYYCPDADWDNYNITSCLQDKPTYSAGVCSQNEGWSLNSTTGQCERAISEPIEYYCPLSGYDLYQNEYCLQRTPTDSKANCPSSGGWVLGGGQCHRTLSESVLYKCDSGFSTYQTSRCLANDFTYSVGICDASNGYSLNPSSGQCEQLLTTSHQHECLDPGFDLYNSDQCLSQRSDLSVGTCPDNYSLQSDGSCQWTQTKAFSYACDETSHSLYNTTECLANTPTLNMGSCPATYALEPTTGTCTKLVYDDIFYSCSSQYDLTDLTSCQAQQPTLNVGTCERQGYTLNPVNGQCEITLTEAVDYQCNDPGFSNYQQDKCLDSDRNPAAISCSLPYVANKITGMCEHTDYVDYTYECVPSSNGEPVTLEGTSCSHFTYLEEIRSCLTAYKQRDEDTCRRILPSDFIGTCSDNTFTVIQTQCQRQTSQDFWYECADADYTVEAGTDQCTKLLQEPVSISCQSDEIEINGTCHRQEKGQKTLYCDAPYSKKGTSLCENRVAVSTF